MIEIRKLITTRETVFSELGVEADRPTTRAVGMAVIRNPFGVAGEMEHGGACVHPMLGKPMRATIGGGKAVIGSNVKVAAAGLCSTCHSGTRTIPGHSRISIRSRSQSPMPLDPTRSWS